MEIKKMHIPPNKNRRPQIRMKPTSITIHNTGNPNSTALNERNWLTNPNNDRIASWHFCVDDKQIIEAIPPNEVAWHCGSDGNYSSIGIEICESGDYNKSILNAIELVKILKKQYNITMIKQHYDWSKKDCPRLIRQGYLGWTWEKFLSMVNTEEEFMEQIKIIINGKVKIVDIINKNGNNYIKIRDLESEKIKIGYENKMPTITTI